MNLGHQMQHLEIFREGELIKYMKCQKCGAVIFEEGDDYANLYCQKALNERQELRKDLEK